MNSRVGRLEWWATFFVANFVSVKAMGLLYRSVLRDGQPLSDASLQSTIMLGLALAASSAVALAVQHRISIRRARDRDIGLAAFWVYAATSAVSVGASFAIAASGSTLPFNPAWIWAPQFAALAWAALEFGVRPGDPMTNRWGPVPKRPFDRAWPKPDNYRPPRN